MRRITLRTGLLASALIAVAIGVTIAISPVADAYNSYNCPFDNTKFVRWAGNSATFDVDHGNFASWWKTEIIYANGIWDADSVGANFNFVLDNQSGNDWYKKTSFMTDWIAVAEYAWNKNTCNLAEVDTWFNTRFSFAICDNCNEGTYDVRTVAMHEFGHWLLLKDIPEWRFLDRGCAMYYWHGKDHTLCGHDKAGIQEIYGTD